MNCAVRFLNIGFGVLVDGWSMGQGGPPPSKAQRSGLDSLPGGGCKMGQFFEIETQGGRGGK